MDDPKDTTRRAWLSAERGSLVLLVLLSIFMVGLWWTRRGAWRDNPAIATTQPAGDYLDKIDPNTANWQTLDCLPGIGQMRAKAIVAYREQSARKPAFTQPEDLRYIRGRDGKGRGIRGIGEKTLLQLEPFLVFPSTQAEP